MKGLRYIINLAALLVATLSVGSCEFRTLDYEHAELKISLYIPDALPTKSETGLVNPLSSESRISRLQVWVFLPGVEGRRVTYKEFIDAEGSPFDSDETGLPHGVVTRFGLPLSDAMYNILSEEGATADVYAVANADARWGLTETTTRDELDRVVLDDNLHLYGGSTENITTASNIPETGLPLSGVLKNAPVTGGYPVLNISELTLTRSVSKIRFVFAQQGTFIPGEEGITPINEHCCIKSISFDGVDGVHDCQIASAEKLFAQNTVSINGTDRPFDIIDYTPLSAAFLPASGATAIIPHENLTTVLDPEMLVFGASGPETAQEYETRLNAAVASTSQLGPIYIRETDKLISGTIIYNITGNDNDDKTAHFSLPLDENNEYDILSRNHSWVVYAFFAEETKTLRLNVEVLPWTWTGYPIDYKSGSVNVIRRFTVPETEPATFKKVKTNDGFYNIYFWHTVKDEEGNDKENVIRGDIIIDTPVGATLHAVLGPGTLENNPPYAASNDVISIVATGSTSSSAVIYPNYQDPDNPNGKIEHCRLEFEIRCKHPEYTRDQLVGNYVNVYFYVEIGDGLRYIDLHSESIDYYRFILWDDWAQSTPPEKNTSGND